MTNFIEELRWRGMLHDMIPGLEDQLAKEMGSRLNSPFMTLSFMALLVIPDLKLSDKGLFDGKKFEFTAVFKGG